MNIECIKVGYLKTNCYIVTCNNETLVIDPGDDINLILKHLEDKNVVAVYYTHSHLDHVGVIKKLLKKYKLKANDFNLDKWGLKVIKSPGHYKDCLTFYYDKFKIMFTGDFLFKGTIGRIDLDGSNAIHMKESLEKIKNYPADTIIYPGHGDNTTLESNLDIINYYLGLL